MATDDRTTTKPRQGRRAFLGALAGGLAAIGLRSAASTPAAQAADGDPLLIGRGNIATTQTDLFVSGAGAAGLAAISSDANGIGVKGEGTGSNSSGVWGSGNIGVFGTSATGAGVFGESTTSGAVGVIAKADVTGGLALRVEGFPQFFSTSGRATVVAGKRSVAVSLAGVVPTDTVLAVVQGGGAFSVKNATPQTGKITIAISKAAKSPVSVGYLVIRT